LIATAKPANNTKRAANDTRRYTNDTKSSPADAIGMTDSPSTAIRAPRERGDVAIKTQERIAIGDKTKLTTINPVLASQKRARFRRPVNENNMVDRGMAIVPVG